jgi:hypothetical protein
VAWGDVKLLAGLIAALALLATMLAVPVLQRRPVSTADCSGRIVILRKPSGEPVECVCIDGVLETCFNPGP